ncbi:MAG: hypothetical protein EOM68_00440 [Spirochaetia bacterium]|nr:hypothetical protein [Spirochaetia bacterium]
MKRVFSFLLVALLNVALLTCFAYAVDANSNYTADWTTVSQTDLGASLTYNSGTGTYTATYTSANLKSGSQYALLVVKGTDKDNYDALSAVTIKYINQTGYQSGSVSFNFIPMSTPSCVVFLCGDFNTDPDAYKDNRAVQPALIDIGEQKARAYMAKGSLGITGTRDLVYSDVWYSPFSDGQNRFEKPGTCYFGGSWHHYDQFFGNGLLFDGLGWEYSSTAIVAPPVALKPDGTPMEWNLSTLSGVSDHLPVLLTLLRR